MSNYKQAIQIGDNVTGIMKLPCVFSCHKTDDGSLEYLLYQWNNRQEYIKAHKGDWLCEGGEGIWSVLTDVEYNEMVLNGKEKNR